MHIHFRHYHVKSFFFLVICEDAGAQFHGMRNEEAKQTLVRW
jgi:hypothetical protein